MAVRSTLKSVLQHVSKQIANVIRHNDLFEQPGERNPTSSLYSVEESAEQFIGPDQPELTADVQRMPLTELEKNPPPVNNDDAEPVLGLPIAENIDIDRPFSDSHAVESAETTNLLNKLPELVTAAGLRQHFAGVRVVNLWATWCDPCVEELPLLKQLTSEIGESSMLGVSWDLFQASPPEAALRAVAEMSQAHELSYQSVVLSDGPDAFFDHFPLENKTVPQTWVLSEDGSVIHCVNGVLSNEDVEDIVVLINADS